MRGTCPDPDHDDGQRAFFVNDRRGVFHCFGCGLHGDVIRWMTDNRDMEYVAAVKHLVRLASLDQQGPDHADAVR
jgi:DNA primase